jgi:hypothetical protein
MHINGAWHVCRASVWLTHSLSDDRNVPALGRINDADDIVASVLVQDGEVRRLFQILVYAYKICVLCRPCRRHISRCPLTASARRMVCRNSRLVLPRSSEPSWSSDLARKGIGSVMWFTSPGSAKKRQRTFHTVHATQSWQ